MFNISKKNIIFFILFFFFIALFLFYWKHSSVIHKKNLKPLKYEEIIKKINTENSKNLNQAEIFIIKNQNIYGTLIALSLAKKYVSYDNFDKAIIQLKNSLKYTKEENLKNILKINIAKIKIKKLENEEAINILKTINNNNWKNIIENMKGDIFINKKNKVEAVRHWKKSLSFEHLNASKEIINMKINELNE